MAVCSICYSNNSYIMVLDLMGIGAGSRPKKKKNDIVIRPKAKPNRAKILKRKIIKKKIIKKSKDCLVSYKNTLKSSFRG